MTASPVPPITMRMTPTDSGVVPSGPSACDVPVVPNSTAAARTASTCILRLYPHRRPPMESGATRSQGPP